ncbi:MAG: 4Fe-4S binding protein [Spirochaetia bacterium]|nr:4Fe-4S binding protein [Spirochaetia bacterium]
MKTPVGALLDHRLQAFSNLLDPKALHVPEPVPTVTLPAEKPRGLARPPGALKDPKKFDKACTRCADCIVACPYGVLFQMGPRTGPLLDPNLNACRVCPDTPCIEACETGALRKLRKTSRPKFGLARLKPQLCRNHESRQPEGKVSRSNLCKICARECPEDKVISFGKDKLPVFAKNCTGCGQCVHVCPTQAIIVDVPVMRF